MESETFGGPRDQGNGFVLTYCHLGKTLWEATALAKVLTEWPLGGEPGETGLAAAWGRGEGGGSHTPGLPPGLVLGGAPSATLFPRAPNSRPDFACSCLSSECSPCSRRIQKYLRGKGRGGAYWKGRG